MIFSSPILAVCTTYIPLIYIYIAYLGDYMLPPHLFRERETAIDQSERLIGANSHPDQVVFPMKRIRSMRLAYLVGACGRDMYGFHVGKIYQATMDPVGF